MSARSRTKGAAFERLVAHALATIYPDACRGVGQARRGSDLADVEGTPWWVECKVGQRPNIHGALRQARDATDGRPCLVVARKNGAGGRPAVDTVTMSLGDFLRLLG